MTDKELFLKYNFITTNRYNKDNQLNDLLYNNKLCYDNQKTEQWLVLLHGSYVCNLKCIYCEHHSLRDEYQTEIITPEIIKSVVYKLGPNIREITWHGGEPLTLPENLFYILEEEKKKYHYSFPTSLQTNLTLLTPEKEKMLHDLNIHWGTSFDGLFNTANRGKLSTDKILNYFSQYAPTGFITVYINNTITKMIDNYEYYKTLGIKEFQSCVVRENVIDATNNFLVNNDIAIREMLKYIKYWIYDIDNPITDLYITRYIGKILGQRGICEDINCIKHWIIVDPLGNISTCGHNTLLEHFCNINDINDYTDLLLNSNYIETFSKQEQLLKEKCYNNCEWYYGCYGGCMGLNYEQDHNYKTINERYCQYTKELCDGIYELIKDLDLKKDINKFNPLFVQLLKNNNYYSLTEIKNIERFYQNAKYCNN